MSCIHIALCIYTALHLRILTWTKYFLAALTLSLATAGAVGCGLRIEPPCFSAACGDLGVMETWRGWSTPAGASRVASKACSHTPGTANVSYTSKVPQNDMCNVLGFALNGLVAAPVMKVYSEGLTPSPSLSLPCSLSPSPSRSLARSLSLSLFLSLSLRRQMAQHGKSSVLRCSENPFNAMFAGGGKPEKESSC